MISPEHYSDVTTRESLRHLNSENIEIIEEYIDLTRLKCLQNESEIHLCLSESEGFSHYICEPLSCGSVVVTINGEPMNELVQPDRGILVEAAFSEPSRYATRFLFDEEGLENKIEQLLVMSDEEKREMKNNGRKWFAHNETFFNESFILMIKNCISTG